MISNGYNCADFVFRYKGRRRRPQMIQLLTFNKNLYNFIKMAFFQPNIRCMIECSVHKIVYDTHGVRILQCIRLSYGIHGIQCIGNGFYGCTQCLLVLIRI